MTGDGSSQITQAADSLRSGQLRVGGFRVDPMENTVSRTGPESGEPVHLEPKIMDVLLALCARQGEVVLREALIESVWGAQYGADESLTRAISILRKALQSGSAGRRAIETFSKRGYRLNLAVATEGAEAGAAGAQNARPAFTGPISARLAAGIAAAVIAGALGAWIWLGGGYREAEAGSETVAAATATQAGQFAIAPWASRSGMTEISETGPRALASAFAQRGISSALLADARLETGGANSEFLVNGEVRQRGESLVVAIAMTNAGDGAVIWADEQTRPGSDAVSLVEGAVAHAANVAECALSARAQYSMAMSSAVLSAWMRHCNAVWMVDGAAAVTTAERLVELSPDEAPAQAALAKIAWSHGSEMEAADSELWRTRARTAATRARELDADNADSLFVLAALEPFGEWNETQRAFEAVNAGQASSRGSDEELLYYLLRSAGYLGEALTHAGFRSARSPGPVHVSEEAWLMATAGLTGRSLAQLDEVIRLYPDYHGSYWRRFNILALHGDLDDARTALLQAQEGLYPGKDGQFTCWEQYLRARLGEIGEEGALSDEACSDIMQEFRARMHGAMGQVDLALEYSRRGLDSAEAMNHRAGTIHLFYPEMAEMRTTPEFWRQADRVGLVDFWISYGRWPDFCSDRRVVVDCPAMADGAIASREG